MLYSGHITLERIPKKQISTCKKINSYLTLNIKTDSKWVNEVNIRGKTIKFIEKNLEINHDLGAGKGFLDMKPKA